MLRLLAAAAVFLICALAGAVRAERLRLRMRALDEIACDIASLETCLRLERADAASVLKQLSENGRRRELWSSIAEQMDGGNSFSAAWEQSRGLLPLDTEELAPLDAFAQGFGKGDIETELARASMLAERFKTCAGRAREALSGRIRAYRAIGSLLGVAAALLVL